MPKEDVEMFIEIDNDKPGKGAPTKQYTNGDLTRYAIA